MLVEEGHDFCVGEFPELVAKGCSESANGADETHGENG